MATQNHKRQIALPAKLWEALDAEATRMRRTSLKQLQWILEDRYDVREPAANVTPIEHIDKLKGTPPLGSGIVNDEKQRQGRR